VQESDPVRRIRILDKMHEETSELGSSGGMTEEQMEALHQSRPAHHHGRGSPVTKRARRQDNPRRH